MTILNHIRQLAAELGEIYPTNEAKKLSKLLGEFILGENYHQLLLDPEKCWKNGQLERFELNAGRLKQGEPIQYITEAANFGELSLKAGPEALIPRPETEELVHLLKMRISDIENPRVLDIGTGSGCISLLLKHLVPGTEVSGIDNSPDALKLAKYNARQLELDVHFALLDITQAKKGQFHRLDLVVSNPPYIPLAQKQEMHRNVRAFEPHEALFVPDEDPLVFYDKISQISPYWLKEGGWLYFEVHEDQAVSISKMMESMAYQEVEIRNDFHGRKRFVLGRNQISKNY